MSRIYSVMVCGFRGEQIRIDLCNTEEQMQSMTVLQLKEKIEEKLPQYEDDTVRLIFKNKMLDGDYTLLSEYGIQHMSMIQMALKAPGGGMRACQRRRPPKPPLC